VTIAIFPMAYQAELLRGYLLAQGIESVVQGALLEMAPGLPAPRWAGVQVQVRAPDAATAARLVAEHDAMHAARHGRPLADAPARLRQTPRAPRPALLRLRLDVDRRAGQLTPCRAHPPAPRLPRAHRPHDRRARPGPPDAPTSCGVARSTSSIPRCPPPSSRGTRRSSRHAPRGQAIVPRRRGYPRHVRAACARRPERAAAEGLAPPARPS
jgi:hypothetical protein